MVKYLGVMLDTGMTFVSHGKEVATKASTVTTALKRLMPNVGSPRRSKRRLLGRVTHIVRRAGMGEFVEGC